MVVNPLAWLAARRPHVLAVVPAGAAVLRWAIEAEVDRRRWVHARSPADADVVVLAGTPGPRLSAVARSVWDTVPGPKALVRVRFADEVAGALDDARRRLVRGGDEVSKGPFSNGVGPIMAGLAEDDRDGLALDALHVPFGPVLPGWPDGLVVHAVLAGDLVTAARAEVLDGAGAPEHADPDRARLDALATVLDLAGAATLAHRARRLRDGAPGDPAELGRRLTQGMTLPIALRGLPLDPGEHGDPDVLARVRRWAGELGSPGPHTRSTPEAAVAALVGHELGAARLILAALDPDTGPPAARPAPSVTTTAAARG